MFYIYITVTVDTFKLNLPILLAPRNKAFLEQITVIQQMKIFTVWDLKSIRLT